MIVSKRVVGDQYVSQASTISAWNPITKDDMKAMAFGGSYIYGKTQAEKALWEFAAEHKDLDVTTCKLLAVVALYPI